LLPCCSEWAHRLSAISRGEVGVGLLGSLLSGALARGDRQAGNELGCPCPSCLEPQHQPGVAEPRRLPGWLGL
jgi:hypothetical protein